LTKKKEEKEEEQKEEWLFISHLSFCASQCAKFFLRWLRL